MNEGQVRKIARMLGLATWQVENILSLWKKDATIPFISRYRKEATGSLDETVIASVIEQYNKLVELDKRRDAIMKSIDEQDELTDELKESLAAAATMTELEDIYLPYKPRKKNRATLAREKGLEGLAGLIFQQNEKDVQADAAKYLNDKVGTIEEALQGARDIIAEWINEDKKARDMIRALFSRTAVIKSIVVKGKEAEGSKYADYFNFHEFLGKCPSHRLLALYRAEAEGILRVGIEPEEEKALEQLSIHYVKGKGECAEQVATAVIDAYKRLLRPSMENEFRALSKDAADDQSIQVFSENLRQLLMAPPLGKMRVMAIDPGFRSGCKVVCLNEHGDLQHNETIFPHAPQNESRLAGKKIASLVDAYKIEAIAIGNGTASRETEQFIKKIRFSRDIKIYIVSEAGASVYSASKTAREEFPDYDVTVRGAVSIGRRLIDPLAELVKIEPKAIGVGQYQHDVNQSKLKASLDQVVESCVNAVGVDLNTASRHLLTYVSGIGPALAHNIINHRNDNGPFKSRNELMLVPRMGAKAFEQAAGFMRIRDGVNPLDNSAVHPESYFIVERIANDLNKELPNIMLDPSLKSNIRMEDYMDDKIGIPTLTDILDELAKPGRDPRKQVRVMEFAEHVHSINDVSAGMTLPGIVTNITGFGVFVDIGIKENGLIHISQLANRFVSNPSEVVKLHQHLKVKVLDVDRERKRIQLTLKDIQS